MDDEQREHLPPVEIDPTMARADHREHLEAVEKHMAAARLAASNMVTRARLLVRNGVDLRHPERVSDFVTDQLMDAVEQATVHECGCPAAKGAAAAALLAVVTADYAALLEGRES